jgi:hypothetical protein
VNLEIVWEIDENPMGTDGNTLRTREKEKQKITLPPPPSRLFMHAC